WGDCGRAYQVPGCSRTGTRKSRAPSGVDRVSVGVSISWKPRSSSTRRAIRFAPARSLITRAGPVRRRSRYRYRSRTSSPASMWSSTGSGSGAASDMSGKTAAAKLGIRPDATVYPINPPGDYAALVGGLPDGAQLTKQRPADVVHAFASTRAELTAHGRAAVDAARPGGLVWISYPKGGRSELKRDLLWDAVP